MVKTILTLAGFVEGKTYKETRFITPPKSTYAIFLDSITRRGGDYVNLINEHSYTIELYSYNKPDPTAEKKIDEALDSLGIEYDKSELYWIETEQLYQRIYDFDYIEK